jgi:hypothetical protein
MTLSPYWRAAREARYSLLFALPLLALYEVLAFGLSGSAFAGVRNGADVLLKTVFVAFGGRYGLGAFTLALLGVGLALVWRDRRRHPGPLAVRYFGLMVGESLAYAAAFGTVVSRLTSLLLAPPLAAAQNAGGVAQLGPGTQLVVSLGAGIYEEILFRVLLVSGLVALGTALKWRRGVAVAFGVVVGALVFAAFHYLGPLGDRWELASFTFRAIAGLLLSGLYVARGFGITAWTHALYDVGLALIH